MSASAITQRYTEKITGLEALIAEYKTSLAQKEISTPSKPEISSVLEIFSPSVTVKMEEYTSGKVF